MIDEGTLKSRFPEIPWDQPVIVYVPGHSAGRWVCRYCIARDGLAAAKLDTTPFAFGTRRDALDHIERVHHD